MLAEGRVTGDAYCDKQHKRWSYQISIPAALSPDGRRRREKSRGPSRYRYVLATYALPWLGTVRLKDAAGRLKEHYRHP
ncbi:MULTISPECIES: hypothetical protein [unclassified Frankia]|uniref:hypothetical protein n=1 Tax=unclassified Frankia TaxID=2632575 RepID=UPI0013041A74|nr:MULTISPECIES: hypothetical protein [unclassified Frankia]